MEKLVLDDPTCIEIAHYLKARGLAYRTNKEYYRVIKKLSKDYGGINRDVMIKFLKEHNRTYEVAALRVINDYCRDNGIDFKLIIPKIKKKARKIPVIYTAEEIKIMIDSAPEPYDLMIRCIFNMGAGLRVNEVIKLSWNWIDWINWMNDRTQKAVCTIKDSKGGKDRVLNIPPKLANDLYEYARKQNKLNEYGRPYGSLIFWVGSSRFKPELFASDIEKWKREYLRYSYDWFRYHILKKHCEEALGKKIKLHALRSSRATYLYEVERVPIEILKELLGHSHLETTLIYTQISKSRILKHVDGVREI